MKRRALLILVSSVLAVPFARTTAQGTRLAVSQPERVTLARTTYSRGSDARAIDAALAQCRREAEGEGPFVCVPDAFGTEHPRRELLISSFAIDRTEVTRVAYARCVADGACRPPRSVPQLPGFDADDVPVVGISWEDARRYCEHVGGRLPTEAEWERAARGAPGRFYPWGDTWNPRLANHGRALDRVAGDDGFETLAPVGSYPSGATPEGLVDMAGNAAEWVFDPFVADAYENSVRVDPVARGASGVRVVRGGSFLAMPYQLRTASRRVEAESDTFADVGFRCAYDAARAGP